MKLSKENWPVYSADRRRARIDPKPAYQRGPVWSQNHQQLFIDSVLRGFDIPKFYLRRVNEGPYDWEVIDGQQRLRAIWGFLRNEYPVSDDSDPIEKHGIAGKNFEDLQDQLVDSFLAYELAIVTVEEADDQEVEDMFLRLQNGMPLNSAEKRNAISGSIRNFVHGLAENNRLMTDSVAFANSRYSHDEVIAQMVLIEMHRGPTSVRHTQLKELYQNNRNFNENSSVANKVKRVLNFLGKAFPQKSPELSKVNLLSLYTLASETLTKYSIADRANEFGNWFIGFENRRRQDEDKPEDHRDERMVSYQLAVLQQTANLASQEERRRILTEDLLTMIPDLILLDDQRLFTHDQRAAIFRKARGKCANPGKSGDCLVECGWNDIHADHLVPYSKGGRTTVANGQLLCRNCNLRKSNK